jgi:hypothetical protein
MNRIAQYAITYKGRLDLAQTFASRDDVDDYVRRAVAAGNDAADYGVQHRTVTYGDWAPTTPVQIKPQRSPGTADAAVLAELAQVTDEQIDAMFATGTTPDTKTLLDSDRDVDDVELPQVVEIARDTCDRDVCTGGHLGCAEPDADHVDEDGVALHCPFCGRATHYSERVGDYRHCDGSACWQTAGDAR